MRCAARGRDHPLCVADRARKRVLAGIVQAGDGGPQAGGKLSPCTLDARTLLVKMGAAGFAKAANLGEFGQRHEARVRDVADVLAHAGAEAVVSRSNPWAQGLEVGDEMPDR